MHVRLLIVLVVLLWSDLLLAQGRVFPPRPGGGSPAGETRGSQRTDTDTAAANLVAAIRANPGNAQQIVKDAMGKNGGSSNDALILAAVVATLGSGSASDAGMVKDVVSGGVAGVLLSTPANQQGGVLEQVTSGVVGALGSNGQAVQAAMSGAGEGIARSTTGNASRAQQLLGAAAKGGARGAAQGGSGATGVQQVTAGLLSGAGQAMGVVITEHGDGTTSGDTATASLLSGAIQQGAVAGINASRHSDKGALIASVGSGLNVGVKTLTVAQGNNQNNNQNTQNNDQNNDQNNQNNDIKNLAKPENAASSS